MKLNRRIFLRTACVVGISASRIAPKIKDITSNVIITSKIH